MNYYNQMFVDWFRNFNKDGKNQEKAKKIYKQFAELQRCENPTELCTIIQRDVLAIVSAEENVFLDLSKNTINSDDKKMRAHSFYENQKDYESEYTKITDEKKQIEFKALNFYFRLLIASFSGDRIILQDPREELQDVVDKMYSAIDTPRPIYFAKKRAETSKSETETLLVDSDSETSIQNQDSFCSGSISSIAPRKLSSPR